MWGQNVCESNIHESSMCRSSMRESSVCEGSMCESSICESSMHLSVQPSWPHSTLAPSALASDPADSTSRRWNRGGRLSESSLPSK